MSDRAQIRDYAQDVRIRELHQALVTTAQLGKDVSDALDVAKTALESISRVGDPFTQNIARAALDQIDDRIKI